MTWQEEFKRNITSAEALREVLPMTDEEYRLIHEEAERFPMAISRYYCSLIDPADPDDPIRRMAVPSSTGRDSKTTIRCTNTSRRSRRRGSP